MTKRIIKYNTENSTVPVIKLKHDDEYFYAIVDSGSDTTIIDDKFAERHGLKSVDTSMSYTYVGFNGTESRDVRSVNLQCSIVDGNDEQYQVNITPVVCDLTGIYDYFDNKSNGEINLTLVLGSDSLYELDSTINFEEGTFSFVTN